ncbi:MAG: TonB-dependent receptor [Phaeodactylibacter sp.]|nr:TonB-dependent receptor [Phaeodactylibacter sp.]
MKLPFLALCLVLAPWAMWGQPQFSVSGYVRDTATGEELAGASVIVSGSGGRGGVSNAYGYYSISLPQGEYELIFSYLGYEPRDVRLALRENVHLDVELKEQAVGLAEVVVTAQEGDENVKSTEMGTVELPMAQVRKLPALMGEVDVLKAMQLLPGVLSAGEGNAGFYVRGGGPDQNLVLLDEALVYNPGHMLGFFSVFNSDAIRNTTLIKGGMPANYGGRLSSVVDIQMKEGNNRHFALEGGLGAISSRLLAEGPIVQGRSSFILAARRTYALDLAQPFLKGTSFEGTNYYFYDLNAKLNYRFSNRDRLYLSAYFGRDVLKFRGRSRSFFFDMPYGNATATLRWNHLFSDKLFLNVSAIYNDYDFGFDGGQGEFRINLFSGVRDWNAKVDFDYFAGLNQQLKFGAHYTYHRLTPNIASASNGEQEFSNNLQSRYAYESGAYLTDEFKLGRRVKAHGGLRFTAFTPAGPYVSPNDSTVYARGEAIKTFLGLEPRFGATVLISSRSSLKAGLTFSNQYLHLVSNSTSTLPIDVWVPSTEVVKPQLGIQYALGYFRNFNENAYEASVEAYYKSLRNQIDYRENYVDDVANDLESEFVFGKGRAYGVEFFLKKNQGRLNGWVGYTLSRTERQFPDINQGRVFPAVYDRRHDLSVVANYALGDKWELGGVFVFGTGSAYTPVESLYFIGQYPVQQYGPRNSARLPDYHRLDLSATFRPRPHSEKRYQSSWVFSIYNVYSRQNPFFIYYDFEPGTAEGTSRAAAYQVSLFPIIPSVSWNFSWRGE